MPNFAVAPENLVKRVGNGTLYIENNALKFRDGSDNVFTLVNTPDYLGSLFQGLQAQTYDRVWAVGAATPVSQRVDANMCVFRSGQVITNLLVGVTVAGAGTAPTLIKLALIDPVTKAVLRQTANLASDPMWLTTGIKVCPLTVPFTIPADGVYWVAPLQNGAHATTPFQIARLTSASATILGTIPGGQPPCVFQTGLTDFPADGGTLALPSSGGFQYWVGAS